MNREIKFRAWDERNKEMITHGFLMEVANYSDLHKNRLPHMQFTGLFDKSGIEIYEGDIVYNKSSMRNHVVEYQNCYFSPFGHYELRGLNDAQYEEEGRVRFEVIGNIYENKDLLDG